MINLIPNGLNRRFFISISNFSQSGRRLCQRFQRKLLLRILSDKHWMLNKYDRKLLLLREELKTFNLGSRFYVQTDQMLTNKITRWKREDYNGLSQKLLRIMKKKNQHLTTRITKEDQDRIQQAKEICNWKLVYNLSDKQIPKETEDLVG